MDQQAQQKQPVPQITGQEVIEQVRMQQQPSNQTLNIQLFQLAAPTKSPQQVFPSKLLSGQSKQQDGDQKNPDDGRSQTSQKSNSQPERRSRKGSWIQRMQGKHQQQQQRLNQKRRADQKAVFLQNVDYKATKEQLQLLFEDCARIQRITILKDPYTNHPKGCAYISFYAEQGVERALHLSGITLRNRIIKVHRKRTNLPGKHKGKKEDLGINFLGMMQNFKTGFKPRGRGRGRGR